MAWGKFSLAGESHKISLRAKKLLFPKPFISWENSPFRGKEKAIFKGKLSLRGKIFPLRENWPNFPLEGKFCPKRCLGNFNSSLPFLPQINPCLAGNLKPRFANHGLQTLGVSENRNEMISTLISESSKPVQIRTCLHETPQKRKTNMHKFAPPRPLLRAPNRNKPTQIRAPSWKPPQRRTYSRRGGANSVVG